MNNEQGQTLIEVIVAATVGILVVTALTFATLFSIRNVNFAKNSAQATKLAQEGIEQVKALRDRNGPVNLTVAGSGGTTTITSFSGLWDVNLSYPLRCYFRLDSTGTLVSGTAVDMENISTNFQRRFTIVDDDGRMDRKNVKVEVFWTDATGKHQSVLTTILSQL